MEKYLTVQQTSIWALTREAQRGAVSGTSVLLCKSFVAFRLHSFLNGMIFRASSNATFWCIPAFWNFPRLLRDAEEQLLVNYKRVINLAVYQKGCDKYPLTDLLKCSAVSEPDTRAQTPPWPLESIPVMQFPPSLFIISLEHSGPLCLKFI